MFIPSALPESRIAGGSVANISNFPFAAALLNNIQYGTFRQLCGGTIISSNAILSSASCFFTGTTAHQEATWRARLGSSSANSGGLVYIIRLITTHPDFVSTTRVHDIAVVRTTLNIMYGPSVQAAYLAGGAYSVPSGQSVTAIGWGATSATSALSPDLRQVNIWVTEQQTCVSRYNALNFMVTDNMICAGWLDVGIRGQCTGDTGSPLLHGNIVVGVFSWAEGCAAARFPNINTRVSVYSRWIEATAVA
ncbi:trypsin CFT-1-like [Zerene cesonia]|uniref:trypsin CFT-1-like n=1 Tax=Zerene cesonia TaxID=33412 RepID=UPI0018E57576|nr:trypsin CFT-1-like [Zerene cesonia]